MLKLQILRKDKDFKAVFSKGKSVGDRYVVMFFLKNGENYNRVSLVIRFPCSMVLTPAFALREMLLFE